MADMLVRLYALPDIGPTGLSINDAGLLLRRPHPWERERLLGWVRETFSPGWAMECETALAQVPPRCFIAIDGDELVGFACHDCTRPNFFGPMGVAEGWRGRGIGQALLHAGLGAMRDAGYAYAIIGGVGPAEFYANTVGAVPIDGSTPGIYDFSLRR